MESKSFIRWNHVNPEKPPKKDKEYLVAEVDKKEGVVFYHICQYYEKGDIVSLPLKEPIQTRQIDPKTASADEKMMFALFGFIDTKEVAIKETGFHIITGKFGLDENEDCICTPIFLGEDAMYGELPLSPEGLLDPNEWKEKEERERKEGDKREEQLQEDVIYDAVKEGGLIDQRINKMKPYNWRNNFSASDSPVIDRDGNEHDGCFEMFGAIFKANERQRDIAYMMSAQMVDTFESLHKAIPDEMFNKAHRDFYNGDKTLNSQIIEDVSKIIKENDTFGIIDPNWSYGWQYRRLIAKLFFIIHEEDDDDALSFQHKIVFRLKSMTWYNNLTTPEKVYVSRRFLSLYFRLRRIEKLRKLKAPGVILANEERIITELVYGIITRPEGFTNDFEKTNHFDLEGNWVELPEDSGEEE